MEEDIQNHSPTVIFLGTPCIICALYSLHVRNYVVNEYVQLYMYLVELERRVKLYNYYNEIILKN